jgi:hypothetical protein
LGYEHWWKTLESLIAEFRKKKVDVPAEAMANLRSAKTMITVYGADPSYVESTPVIETYLLSTESTLMNIARDGLGQDFVEHWLRKLEKARGTEESKPAGGTRFVPGVPRDQHWIRVLPSDDVLKEDVEKLAGELELSHKLQNDGYILVYGNKAGVKDFVKKLAEKCRRTGKK